jgi:uncharacterized coiled-coil DUF342 family protein
LEGDLARAIEEKDIVEKKFKDLSAQFDTLKQKYSEAESLNQKLQNEKEALENDVAELRNRYNKLKEKTDERFALELKGNNHTHRNHGHFTTSISTR